VRSHRLGLAGLVSVLLTAAGCAPATEYVHGTPVRLVETSVRLHAHDLAIHLSPGTTPHGVGPLLVYATGDAGWWGKDKDLFYTLVRWGYPVAGFSAREYLHHLGPNVEVERRVQLANDYAEIVRAAETTLELPATESIVLVGKSRGAGLEVAAATTARLRPILRGVLAVGLTREEEYIRRRRPGARRDQPLIMLQNYEAIPQLGAVPLAVIQSTGDEYLPAADARALFGPDTPTRHFIEVPSKDHNFSGMLPELYDEMARGLDWILQR
jgi:hypothetical protein